MKTERRHELQTNELAIWLTGWIETIRPYSKAIIGGLLLITTVWFAYAYIGKRGEQNQAQAWSAFFQAYEQGAEPDRLAEVAASFGDTRAGLWALQSAADLHLAQGTQDLFRDRQQAEEELQQAKDAYASVSQQASDPLLKQRAAFGLAQALESLGQFGPADEKYREVAEQWPNSGVGQLAQRRLEMLQQPATREWYAWFAEQKPIPSPLVDPSLLNVLPNLPDSPDISLPGPGELIRPSGESPAASSPATDGLPLNLNLDDALPIGSGSPLPTGYGRRRAQRGLQVTDTRCAHRRLGAGGIHIGAARPGRPHGGRSSPGRPLKGA